MEKDLVSGLGGAQPSPNPLVYGQSALCTVWLHTRSLAFISLLFMCLYLPDPAFAAQASTPQPAGTGTGKTMGTKDATKPQLKKTAPSAPSITAQTPAPAKPKPPKTVGRAKTSAKIPQAPHADAWAFGTQKPRPVDSIWTRGMAPQALKQAAVHGLTDKAIKKGLKAPEAPPVLPPKAQLDKSPLSPPAGADKTRAKGMQLRGDMDTVSSGWHSSGLKNNLRIDQDMSRQETNIYGAYADIDAGDDVTLSAGPEFSHTRTQGATQSSTHTQTDSGSLGLGVHLKWDF